MEISFSHRLWTSFCSSQSNSSQNISLLTDEAFSDTSRSQVSPDWSCLPHLPWDNAENLAEWVSSENWTAWDYAGILPSEETEVEVIFWSYCTSPCSVSLLGGCLNIPVMSLSQLVMVRAGEISEVQSKELSSEKCFSEEYSNYARYWNLQNWRLKIKSVGNLRKKGSHEICVTLWA